MVQKITRSCYWKVTPLLSDIANDPHGPLLWPDTALQLSLLLGHVWPSTFTGIAKSQGNARRRKQLMCFKTILSHGSVTPSWTPASTPLQLLHLEDCNDYWVNCSVGISEVTSTELHTIELGNRQCRQLHRKFQREFSSQIIFPWCCQEVHESKCSGATWWLSRLAYAFIPPSTTTPPTTLISHHLPKSFQGSPGGSATSAWLFSDPPPTYACRRLSLGNTTSSQW